MDSFLTPEETAQVLKVQVATVRRWLRDGTLQGRKLGRVWRIPHSELQKISHPEIKIEDGRETAT
jgi:acetyl-CoA synthetase